MIKNIFYGLSVLVAGTAAYWSFDNKGKLEAEIALFDDTRTKKDAVERNEDKTDGILKETEATLEEAEQKNAELIADMENMKSRESSMNKSKEEAQVKIDEAEARLADFAKVKAEIDEQLKGVNVAWAQIPAEIKRQQEVRKKRGDDLDLLNEHIAKLTKDAKLLADKPPDSRLRSLEAKLKDLEDKLAAVGSSTPAPTWSRKCWCCGTACPSTVP